jgi:ribosomal-protein-alanine N-acetyltransferase
MQLRTARLALREFRPEDWADVLAYQNDSRYLAYTQWDERSESDVQALVDLFVLWQHEDPRLRFQLAVTASGNAQVIGSCGIRRDATNLSYAELGYEVAATYSGQGLATEAAEALVQFGFSELGLNGITSRCIADNGASVAVLEKLGFRLESSMRANEHFKERSWDTLVYALSREQWTKRT